MGAIIICELGDRNADVSIGGLFFGSEKIGRMRNVRRQCIGDDCQIFNVVHGLRHNCQTK